MISCRTQCSQLVYLHTIDSLLVAVREREGGKRRSEGGRVGGEREREGGGGEGGGKEQGGRGRGGHIIQFMMGAEEPVIPGQCLFCVRSHQQGIHMHNVSFV